MRIIGLHNGHDASIAAFEDGEMVFYWELERVLNKKHYCGVDYKTSPIIDVLFDHCLPKLGWKFEDIDYFALGGQTEWKNTELDKVVGNGRYENNLNKPWGEFSGVLRGRLCKFIAVTHHVSHMALAYYTSPYDTCMTFAYDGVGDFDTSTVAGVGINGKLHYLVNFRHYPLPGTTNNSIGLTYSLLGRVFPFLGNANLLATAGKAMGLSSYGTPYPKDHPIYQICYNTMTEWMPKPERVWAQIEPFGITRADCSTAMNEKCQNLMATFQECLENYVCDTISVFKDNIPEELNIGDVTTKLAIAGGCALNVQANSRLLQEKVVDKLYVPPATSDCGIAYGAVLYAYYHVLDNEWTPVKWHDPYLGDTLYAAPPIYKKHLTRNYTEADKVRDDFWKQINEGYPALRCEWREDYINFAAKELADGKLVAWAQGRMEIGPRALCNRSILSHPGVCSKENKGILYTQWHNGGVITEGTMKDTINAKVKHREFWRPFAPVALWPECQAYFDIDHEQPYMLESPLAKNWNTMETWPEIAATVHSDGTCRVQTVTEDTNILMYKLLQEFYNLTDIPVLLNTSLNDAGSPIANELGDILHLLEGSELDYAIVGNCIFSKRS